MTSVVTFEAARGNEGCSGSAKDAEEREDGGEVGKIGGNIDLLRSSLVPISYTIGSKHYGRHVSVQTRGVVRSRDAAELEQRHTKREQGTLQMADCIALRRALFPSTARSAPPRLHARSDEDGSGGRAEGGVGREEGNSGDGREVRSNCVRKPQWGGVSGLRACAPPSINMFVAHCAIMIIASTAYR